MSEIWAFLIDENNRGVVTLIAGAVVSLGAGFWAIFIYFRPPRSHEIPLATAPEPGLGKTDSAVTVINGMSERAVYELMHMALSNDEADKHELRARLDETIPKTSRLRVEAVEKFFRILGERQVKTEDLAERFSEIARDHLKLREDIRAFRVKDADVQALREAAAEALETADHDTARTRLQEARAFVREKREEVSRVLAEQQREESALLAEQAQVELARLAYPEAARLFEEAAEMLPKDAQKARWQNIIDAADAWRRHGNRIADRAAMNRSITLCQDALILVSRKTSSLDWATTKHKLGLALSRSGELEGSTALLESAVSAYRAALQERVRERVPLDWASTQNNLGIALWILGRMERGTDRINEAVVAFRLALEEWTRERVPLDWALAQSNLGAALTIIGERSNEMRYVEESISIYCNSLEEKDLELNPLSWATTQNNIGYSFYVLALSGRGKNFLEKSLAAYRKSLQIRTRERTPFDWAHTQRNLSLALEIMAEWTLDSAYLHEALVSARAGAEVGFRSMDKESEPTKLDLRITLLERRLTEIKNHKNSSGS